MQKDASSQGSSNETREWPSPEAVAAAVNAIVVVCLPVILIITMWLTPTTSVTVHADPASATAFVKLAETLFVFVPFTPFAAVAAWRTWTHARRYLDGNGAGWRE